VARYAVVGEDPTHASWQVVLIGVQQLGDGTESQGPERFDVVFGSHVLMLHADLTRADTRLK